MQIDQNIARKITGIQFSNSEPTSSTVIWAHPEEGEYVFKVFNNGTWNVITNGQGSSINTEELLAQIAEMLNSKADKATTLEGYGITDAYISGNTITLGEDSISAYVKPERGIPSTDLASGILPKIFVSSVTTAFYTMPINAYLLKTRPLNIIDISLTAMAEGNITSEAFCNILAFTTDDNPTLWLHPESYTVYLQKDFELKPNTTYELNVLWNGNYFTITQVEFELQATAGGEG